MKPNNVREITKLLLLKENISISKLAEMLSSEDKKFYQQTLSAKLINETLKFSEFLKICDILGYDIELIKRK